MWVQERERFNGQREKVRPIIILSEMDICSDPSKLDRTCNHVHPSEERVYFFLCHCQRSMSCSASQFLGFLLHFNGNTQRSTGVMTSLGALAAILALMLPR